MTEKTNKNRSQGFSNNKPVVFPDALRGVFDTSDLGCGIIFGDHIYKDMNPKPCGIHFEGEHRLCEDCRKIKEERQRLKVEVEKILNEIKMDYHRGKLQELKKRLGIK